MSQANARRRLALSLLIAVLLFALSPGRPAQAHEATGFLTFETGADGAAIALPGITFAANEAGWVYGDVRTRRYNAPYPQSCEDRPADIAQEVCEYAVGQNFFAWTGVVGGSGQFSFTQGTASFVDFDIAAGDDVTVVAYSPDSRPIAAQAIGANAGAGARNVQLSAPAGERIAYVAIRGAANFWLLDNLATDAPGVPDQRPREQVRPARVSVVLRATPNRAAAPGELVTLTAVVVNRGAGRADQVSLTLPLEGLPVDVLDASFSRAGAWVRRLDAGALAIDTGALGSGGDTITATLRLRVRPDAPAGAALVDRASFAWLDRASGGAGRSNLPALHAAGQRGDVALYELSATPAGDGRASYAFEAAIFAPGEPVAFWYDSPGGTTVAIATVVADAEGRARAQLDASGLAAGAYTVVAFGHWTEFTATAPLNVQ